jgi:hypothetical protein
MKILRNGFSPFYSLEDTSWLDDPRFKRLAFPMVCFCDIPIGRITDHIRDYGTYGLGMSREWALRHHLNPVVYMSPGSPFSQSYRDMVERVLGGNHYSQWTLLYFLAFLKPTTGVGKRSTTKEFYQESEWRHVPYTTTIRPCITEETYNDTKLRDELNLSASNEKIQFCQQDIRYIFVSNDRCIPRLANFIHTDLVGFSDDDRKILTSRITSLEHLKKDL